MLRIRRLTLTEVNKMADDIERRINRLDSKSTTISGWSVSYDPEQGKITLSKNGDIKTFTEDA